MAIVSARIRGLDALRARFDVLSDVARRSAGSALFETAETAAADLRGALRAGRGPSAPGEAPADPAARIADAVTTTLDDDGSGASLVVALPFARDLEFGTVKMAARPFLRPAAQRAGSDAKSLLAKAVAAVLKGPNP